MASTIITKNSSTASAVPVVGDLTKGELAVNVTDKKIYTKDNSAAVVKLVGSLGNQEANAVAITGGSIAGITDLAVADGGTGASTASDARTNLGLGTIATQAASSVTITGGSVTGITDITVADGGTGASTAANARTNLGAAASGANSDITSLSGLTTALSVAQGGTGITSFGSGVATFLGTPSSANLLAAVTDETGTGALVFANTPTLVAPILGTPTSGNFSSGSFTWPTFNQNTTGTAAGLSATLAIASGGTGATTAGGALTSLGAYAASNPSGYTSNTGTVTSVGGTGTVNGLTLTGTVTTSGNLTLGGTLSGVSLTSQVSGTLPTANGGTNLTSFTSGGVVYASSTSALATGSALTFDGSKLTVTGATGASYLVLNAPTDGGYASLQTGGTTFADFGSFKGINGSGSATDFYLGTRSTNNLIFGTNFTEGLRLTSTSLYTASGINVAVGTSTATNARFYVEGVSASSTPTIATFTGGFSAAVTSFSALAGLQLFSYQSVSGSPYTKTSAIIANSDGTVPSELQFWTKTDGQSSPALRATIDSSGRFMVGTATPLDIATVVMSGSTNGNGLTVRAANSSGAGSQPGIVFASSAGVIAGQVFADVGGSSLYLNNGSGGSTVFLRNSTESARFDSSGNLLVGTTSSSGSGATSGKQVIQFNGATGNGLYIDDTRTSAGIDTAIIFARGTDVKGALDTTLSSFRVRAVGDLVFAANSTDYARIDTSGNLLVGTTSGSANIFLKDNANDLVLDVANSSSSNCYGLRVRYSAVAPNTIGYYFYRAQDNAATRFEVYSNGGISNYQANDNNLSDRREKTNFTPATSYLDKICAIPVQTFNYIDQNLEEDGGLTLGVVAQDVQAVAPELVTETNWGTKEEPKMRLSIYQTDLQYALMKCIQEQQAIIESLKARLDAANL